MSVFLKKYSVHLILLVYLFKVYGALLLNKFDIISDQTWCNIHYVGVCVLFCSFLFLLKKSISSFIYSLGTSIFVSRLVTELFFSGKEYWHEMLFVILFTCIIYYLSKKFK